MSSRVMPFRGSLTSRDQVAVYEFSWPAVIFIPLVAVLVQIFIPVRVRFLPIIDLPLMVTTNTEVREAVGDPVADDSEATEEWSSAAD